MGRAALVVGASGGIGAALIARWRAESRYDRVIALARTPPVQAENVAYLPIDLENGDAIANLGHQVSTLLGDHSLETVCICSGLLHDTQCRPEKRIADVDAAAFNKLMQVNALGPLLVAQQLVPLLPRDQLSRILAVSARVGSIDDNGLGGWLSYRASKAALNQAFQTLAVELQRTCPQCVVTLYHPGTVDTALSLPFQRNVPKDKLFTADFAAECLSQVLHNRVDPAAHRFVDWAGKPISF